MPGRKNNEKTRNSTDSESYRIEKTQERYEEHTNHSNHNHNINQPNITHRREAQTLFTLKNSEVHCFFGTFGTIVQYDSTIRVATFQFRLFFVSCSLSVVSPLPSMAVVFTPFFHQLTKKKNLKKYVQVYFSCHSFREKRITHTKSCGEK